ncbi:MAG: group II intron reverse transcriptase/maturase [Candidatus Eisenbacteria bacterium]
MVLDDKSPQMPAQAGLVTTEQGEARSRRHSEEASAAIHGNERSGASGMMERALSRSNLTAALKRVERNKGSAGVDGMTVDELRGFLRREWPRIREDLLTGRYRPLPVKRVEIPKPDGGTRKLGVPSVVDRFIQQALLQVLQPMIDPTFSPNSYGFRPGRSAHQAILMAQRFVQEGRSIVVDVDLEKFFDRVNHDVLMGRLAKRIDDTRVLGLIRQFLEAGVMVLGVLEEGREGTPQGGPLSPLLANILLDEVDKELEHRGHAFVRYADDLNVYVRSKAAGGRVMRLLRHLFDGLRLRINEEKSAVADATTRTFLGFVLYRYRGEVKRAVAPKAMAKMKDRVRALTRRSGGKSLADVVDKLALYLRGWRGYFRLAQSQRRLTDIDGWIRHRLRALKLKQWRRGTTAFREALRMGANPDQAAQIASGLRRWWLNARMLANSIMPNRFFDELGLPRLGA